MCAGEAKAVTAGTRIAVIGAGHQGAIHARVLHRLWADQPAWVVDVDEARAGQVAAEVGALATREAGQVLAQVDAVVVATPTESHVAVAGAALEAGCHVLVEKPLAPTAEAGEAHIAQAEAAGRVLQVSHGERFNPIFQALRGEIGVPVYVTAERLAPFAGRSLDIDVGLDLIIHDLDLLLHMVPAELESVDAVGIPVLTTQTGYAALLRTEICTTRCRTCCTTPSLRWATRLCLKATTRTRLMRVLQNLWRTPSSTCGKFLRRQSG